MSFPLLSFLRSDSPPFCHREAQLLKHPALPMASCWFYTLPLNNSECAWGMPLPLYPPSWSISPRFSFSFSFPSVESTYCSPHRRSPLSNEILFRWPCLRLPVCIGFLGLTLPCPSFFGHTFRFPPGGLTDFRFLSSCWVMVILAGEPPPPPPPQHKPPPLPGGGPPPPPPPPPPLAVVVSLRGSLPVKLRQDSDLPSAAASSLETKPSLYRRIVAKQFPRAHPYPTARFMGPQFWGLFPSIPAGFPGFFFLMTTVLFCTKSPMLRPPPRADVNRSFFIKPAGLSSTPSFFISNRWVFWRGTLPFSRCPVEHALCSLSIFVFLQDLTTDEFREYRSVPTPVSVDEDFKEDQRVPPFIVSFYCSTCPSHLDSSWFYSLVVRIRRYHPTMECSLG